MQIVAQSLLQQCSGHALTIRIIAGVLRRDSRQHSVTAWQEAAQLFNERLSMAEAHEVSDYERPLQAYKLSIAAMTAPGGGSSRAQGLTGGGSGAPHHSLLGVLALFAPVKPLPVEVLRLVWRICCGEEESAFQRALYMLTSANIVDTAGFSHHSHHGSALSRMASCFVRPCSIKGGMGSAAHFAGSHA